MNELRRHTDAAAGAAHAALEHVRHAERAGNPADVLVLPFERERRRARDHLEAGHLRERVDDLFRETVAEILVVGIPAHVGEREHGDRWCAVRRFGPLRAQLLQRRFDVGSSSESDATAAWRGSA